MKGSIFMDGFCLGASTVLLFMLYGEDWTGFLITLVCMALLIPITVYDFKKHGK